MKHILLIPVLVYAAIGGYAQNISQTVRGNVVDADNRMAIPGVTVLLPDSDSTIGTITDGNGNFKLENIPIGRITLQFSFLGYETKTLTNLTVNSAQQFVINVELSESVIAINEVSVKANREDGEALNDMAMISVRSISPEETKRFSAGYDDPSHIITNFAGVNSSQSGNNDIIVRGNSPKYIQWRLEGIEISTPYHQSDQNSTVQGFSLINNKLLATSDFYTGAFAPEYGNALSGIYDIKLKPGNNEKFEAAASIGLMGTDLILEGPFKKAYGGSYLINYRYSTIGLLQDMGLVNIDGVSTVFQDATFKVVLPAKKAGSFSIFGLAGLDNLSVDDVEPGTWVTPGDNDMLSDVVENLEQNGSLFNIGMNHTYSINNKSYIKTTLSHMIRDISEDVFESYIVDGVDDLGLAVQDTVGDILNYSSRYKTSVSSAKTVYNNKINPNNKIRLGMEYSFHHYSIDQSQLSDDNLTRTTLLDYDGGINTFQSFISWKHYFNEDIILVGGLHNMNVLLTNESTLEPRIALTWKINSSNTLNAGFGNHSTMERIHNYFVCIEQDDGSYTYPNKDLELLKAYHYVIGYQRKITANITSKIEVYYQDLYNLPVENDVNSYYSTINENSDYMYVDLVNEGTGRNYGVEVTLERYFNNNYYFLLNGTLYESKYTALDGIERNTRFNNNYLCNLLAGKEFELGKNQNKTLTINAKFLFSGGQRYIPLLRDANGNLAVDEENGLFYDYSKAYENKFDDLFELNLSVSYKINLLKFTHELFLELNNLTNNRGRMAEYYDTSEPGNIGYIRHMAFLPSFMYRIYL